MLRVDEALDDANDLQMSSSTRVGRFLALSARARMASADTLLPPKEHTGRFGFSEIVVGSFRDAWCGSSRTTSLLTGSGFERAGRWSDGEVRARSRRPLEFRYGCATVQDLTTPPNRRCHLTRGRRGCKRCVPCARTLSLGR